MARSIGLVEYRTVSSGITAADTMVKTADIEVLQASAVCPGKYVIIVAGELSAVKASVDAAKAKNPEQMVDSFVLGNPHEDIFRAIYGGGEIGDAKALGVLEALSAPSMIVAADTAAKASEVKLIELRIARGLGGRSYMLLTGTVASVSAAIERAKEEVSKSGWFLDSSIIANPDKKLWESII